MAYGESNGHLTHDVTWPQRYRRLSWRQLGFFLLQKFSMTKLTSALTSC